MYTILALMEFGDLRRSHKWSNVPGLWFWEDEKVRSTPAAKVIPSKELAVELPGVAWDLLPMKAYRAHNWHSFEDLSQRSSYASLYTSLGCPYKCSFCCINAPFGKPAYRCWDSDFVVNELEHLVNQYGVRNVKFVDELFVLQSDRVKEVCKKIIDRGLSLNIWAYARVDILEDEAVLELLKKAGVKWLCLGIESASSFVREGSRKGKFGESDIIDSVQRVHDFDISVLGNFIFGLPDDTWSSMQQTLMMAKELKLEFANFYAAMAYPGSMLYQQALAGKWPLPKNWSDYSQHARDTLPLPTDTLSGAEVLAYRDYAWDHYFTDSKYLSHLDKKFGTPARSHIESVSKHVLERSHKAEVPEQYKIK